MLMFKFNYAHFMIINLNAKNFNIQKFKLLYDVESERIPMVKKNF